MGWRSAPDGERRAFRGNQARWTKSAVSVLLSAATRTARAALIAEIGPEMKQGSRERVCI